MTEVTTYVHAKRGMVLVHHIHTSEWVNGTEGPLGHIEGHSVDRDEYRIGVVTSVTRGGLVMAFRTAGWGTDRLGTAEPGPAVKRFRGRIFLAPGIAAEPAIDLAKAHYWPNHPGQPAPWTDLDTVKHALATLRAETI